MLYNVNIMVNQQLLDFIKSQLSKGLDKETITKELLGSGWLEQDIKEGFGMVDIPMISQPTNSIINPVYSSDTNNPILTQIPNHSGKKVLLVIVALFIIAGGASGYYFRNDIPIIKDLIKSKNIVPVSEIKQEDNVQAQIQGEGDIAQSKQEQEVTDQDVEKPSNFPNTEIIDCGNDLNCFIKLANECQKTKVRVTKINVPTPIFDIGTIDATTDIEITGKEGNNCVSRIKVVDYKFKYNENGVATMLSQGASQDDIKKAELDNSELMIGSGHICKIDSSKKTGEAIIQLMNNSGNLSVECNNSTCSYGSGLSCESFLKLNDNKNCKLQTNDEGFEVSMGVTSIDESVSGFNGSENKVSWSVSNKNIIEISSSIGTSITIKPLKIGTTDLTATDNSIGKDCFVTIPIKVFE